MFSGYNRVRFPTAVPVGSMIRMRADIVDVVDVVDVGGGEQLTVDLAVEIDVRLADGRTLIVHADSILLDGVPVELSPAPLSVLDSLHVNPGHVVPRRALLAALPSGQAGSEHAVEMAVARLRAAIGTKAVVTVVKRGYRLAVG